MTKKKTTVDTDLRLIQIKELSFNFSAPESFQTRPEFQFRVALEISLDATKQKFVVDNKIDIRADSEGPVLCSLDTRYYFELVGEAGRGVLAKEVQLSANTIALSTTRGILFSRLRGTSLHNAVLPLIDATNFSANEVEG